MLIQQNLATDLTNPRPLIRSGAVGNENRCKVVNVRYRGEKHIEAVGEKRPI
jgi:hypothetical protein